MDDALLKINEISSEDGVKINTIGSYGNTTMSTINIVSIAIRAFEKVDKICEQVSSILEELSKNSTDMDPKKVGDNKLEVYNQLSKALQIIIEFRKIFAVSTEHPEYEHLKLIDQRLDLMHERIALALGTMKPQFLDEAKRLSTYMINFFMELRKILTS